MFASEAAFRPSLRALAAAALAAGAGPALAGGFLAANFNWKF